MLRRSFLGTLASTLGACVPVNLFASYQSDKNKPRIVHDQGIRGETLFPYTIRVNNHPLPVVVGTVPTEAWNKCRVLQYLQQQIEKYVLNPWVWPDEPVTLVLTIDLSLMPFQRGGLYVHPDKPERDLVFLRFTRTQIIDVLHTDHMANHMEGLFKLEYQYAIVLLDPESTARYRKSFRELEEQLDKMETRTWDPSSPLATQQGQGGVIDLGEAYPEIKKLYPKRSLA